MNRIVTLSLAIVLAMSITQSALAQRGRILTPEERAERQMQQAEQLLEELREPSPLPALNSVWIEELTWMEVRDAIADGKTIAIISTGGIEQNGPYVATGKHNYILESACEMLARQMGNALCAPIVKFVPEGSIDPPSGSMRYHGTISLQQEVFEALLVDIGASLAQHGFEHVVYIGDSGGNQRGQMNAAATLNERWGRTRAHHIAEYYDNSGVIARMEELGVVEGESDGFHDYYWVTAMQMVTDPSTVRYDERVVAGMATINGLSIAPKEETVEIGRQLIQWRVDQTENAINAAIAGSR
jgi:creatinine amidohydrolase/Fe(II)-dependent formamide hydrolase-like protein